MNISLLNLSSNITTSLLHFFISPPKIIYYAYTGLLLVLFIQKQGLCLKCIIFIQGEGHKNIQNTK